MAGSETSGGDHRSETCSARRLVYSGGHLLLVSPYKKPYKKTKNCRDLLCTTARSRGSWVMGGRAGSCTLADDVYTEQMSLEGDQSASDKTERSRHMLPFNVTAKAPTEPPSRVSLTGVASPGRPSSALQEQMRRFFL